MYGYEGGKEGGWDELGDWDWCIHTIDTMCKIDNWWEPITQHRELYVELCGDLNGKEINERGTYVHMWLVHYIAETSKTL